MATNRNEKETLTTDPSPPSPALNPTRAPEDAESTERIARELRERLDATRSEVVIREQVAAGRLAREIREREIRAREDSERFLRALKEREIRDQEDVERFARDLRAGRESSVADQRFAPNNSFWTEPGYGAQGFGTTDYGYRAQGFVTTDYGYGTGENPGVAFPDRIDTAPPFSVDPNNPLPPEAQYAARQLRVGREVVAQNQLAQVQGVYQSLEMPADHASWADSPRRRFRR